MVHQNVVARQERIGKGDQYFEAFVVETRSYWYRAKWDVLELMGWQEGFKKEWFVPGIGLVKSTSRLITNICTQNDIIEFFDPRTAFHWKIPAPKDAKKKIFGGTMWLGPDAETWDRVYKQQKALWKSWGLTYPDFWEE